MSVWYRLRALIHRRRMEQELADELEHHRSMKAQRGEDPRALGSDAYWREETRAVWTWPALEAWFADARYAARRLWHARAFSLVAIVTLALGTGATTAIFSLLNTLLWRPLPVREPHELVRVVLTHLPPGERHWVDGRPVPALEREAMSFAMYEALVRRADRLFTRSFALAGRGEIHVDYRGTPRQVRFAVASGNVWATLGIEPRAGRFYGPADDVPGGRPGAANWPAVISEGLWERMFQRSPDALGGLIAVDSVPFVITGVAPDRFEGVSPGSPVDLWLPLMASEAVFPLFKWRLDPSVANLRMFARLAPGVDFARAEGQLTALAPAVMEDALAPGTSEDQKRYLRAMHLEPRPAASGFSPLAASFRTPLFILLGAVAAVLLVAATNLTSLFLARNAARGQELAIRVSLGAPAGRLRREILLESLWLSLAGVVAGAALGLLLARGIERLVSDTLSLTLMPDLRVFGFLAAVLAAVTLVSGGLPGWQASRTDPQGALKGAGGSPRALRLRGGLIVLQTALSLALVAGAGLMTSTLASLAREETGYSPRTLFLWPDLFNAGVSRERMPLAYERVLERIRALPQIEAAGWTTIIPLSGSLQMFTLDRPDLPAPARAVFSMHVSDGYLAAAGLRLLAGRDLSPAAVPKPNTAILSRGAAERLFGSIAGAVGQRLKPIGDEPAFEVIGVAADAKYHDLRAAAPPMVYRPYYRRIRPGYPLALRLHGSRAEALAAVTRAIEAEVGRVPFVRVHTLDENRRALVSRERLLGWLLAALAGLALVISATGLAGLLAYAVEQRRREFGIRLALGATTRGVQGLILRHGLGLALAGIACGAALAAPLRRGLDAFLYGVRGDGLGIWIAAAGLTLAAAVLAVAGPLRKAGRVDPARILRVD